MKPAAIPRESTASEPVELYNIICPDGRPIRPRGFYSASGVPTNAEAAQRDAEEQCKRIAKGRKGYVVQYLCEAIAPRTPF